LTSLLADRLGLRLGDRVAVEALENPRRTTDLPVVATIDELLGFGAYVSPAAMARFLGEGSFATGARLAVVSDRQRAVEAALRDFPAVAGVGVRAGTLAAFDRTIAESFRISLVTILSFACLIAGAVVYNGGRISLSERARELASLRILGFTRGEVAAMLLLEQGVLTAAAIPLGWTLGYGFCYLMVTRFASESFRLPLIVSSRTFVAAAAVVVGAAVATGWALRHRANRLDLVAVLKARE
ncbi:MAG: ABC transporter permease, partial [Gemmatimonadales bacterium]